MKKSGAQKAAATAAPVKQSSVKQSSAGKSPTKTSAVKKSVAKQAPAKRPAAKKSVAKTAVPTKRAPKKPANPLVPRRTTADMAALPPLPQIPAGMRLGTHVSSQGGSFAAPPRATEIGATALQLFTKTPNQWKERDIDEAERAQFRAALQAAGDPVTVSHDSYLINLASPDAEMRTRSIESFATELRRCHALGIDYLVSHPGNFMDDHDAGIARNAAASRPRSPSRCRRNRARRSSASRRRPAPAQRSDAASRNWRP